MWIFKILGCPKACTVACWLCFFFCYSNFFRFLEFCPKIFVFFSLLVFIQNNVPLKSFCFLDLSFFLNRNNVDFNFGLLFVFFFLPKCWFFFVVFFSGVLSTKCLNITALRCKCYTNKRVGFPGIIIDNW